MLVLSRKQGQSVEFAEVDVVVRVISVKGSRVQLGIEAPPEITVTRSEKPDSHPARGMEDLPESHRVRDELSRVQSELAALAELADENNLLLARQVAADSMQRLEGIQRSLFVAARQKRTQARPIGELVKVRTEVLERLRDQQSRPDMADGRETCVRQSPSDYEVPSALVAC